MMGVTSMREAKRNLKYNGNLGVVSINIDSPHENCYYCNSIKGKREAANIERYITELKD